MVILRMDLGEIIRAVQVRRDEEENGSSGPGYTFNNAESAGAWG